MLSLLHGSLFSFLLWQFYYIHLKIICIHIYLHKLFTAFEKAAKNKASKAKTAFDDFSLMNQQIPLYKWIHLLK